MTLLEETIKEIIKYDAIHDMKTPQNYVEEFREKWGRFYYSDTVGMDWEKPAKQNVTGGIRDGHDGFCIASGDMEKILLSSLEEYGKQCGEESIRQARQKVQEIQLVIEGRDKKASEILIEVNRILSPILASLNQPTTLTK